MSLKLKIFLLIIIGFVSYATWGIASYYIGGTQWVTFVNYNQYIALTVIALIVPHAKSFISGDAPPPPPTAAQPTTTTETSQ